MIDKWFKQDIDEIYALHNIVVVVDESEQAEFLLKGLENDVTVITTSTELEELKAKYEIEKHADADRKYIIYTSTPKSELKFIREYCETNGCIEIKHLENYIKIKVNDHLNLNINLPKEELITAAKVSVGQTESYWMDLSHKGSSEIFDLERELLPFLHNPKDLERKYDAETCTIFYKSVAELIGQTYIEKPVETFATEVVNYMLDGLLKNDINTTLLNVYNRWVDSSSYKPSFLQYLQNYKLIKKEKPYDIHPSHPFEKIDEVWLQEIGANITDAEYIKQILPKIKLRSRDKIANGLNIKFWSNVTALLEFDVKNINQINSFQEAVGFYIKHFYKLDGAIRKLYSRFLTQRDIIEPIQEYYKNLSTIFLDKWFRYFDEFKSNQTGVIQNILNKHANKTAIVVGDGVSWEFAQDIVAAFGKTSYEFTQNHLYAGLPTETEHNMSQLYVDSGEVFATKKERENYLSQNNTDKEIEYIDLEDVNETTDKTHYLICSCKDPDKLGETYQQKALKYFDKVALIFADKIKQLLKNGYQQVYLVTDHGFTLTGILESSDKIEVDITGKASKSERYIRSNDQQDLDKNLFMEKPAKYGEYKYIYFAKRVGPFKTPGVYGFSHGGITPQETLIPFFKWSNSDVNEELLEISITNKRDLKDVTGNLYAIKLKGNASSDSLFSANRKILLMFFVKGEKVNESSIVTIEKSEEVKMEFQFGAYTTIDIRVLDATTKEQLDKATVSKSAARDLGGLF